MQDCLDTEKDYRLWVLLAQTREALFRVRQRELEPYSVTARQAAVLSTIDTLGEKASPSLISRWLYRKPHSISGVVNRMEKEGLVTKVNGQGSKKARITLTEKGQAILQQSRKRESIHQIMSCLSEKERQQLWLLLNKLRDEAIKQLTLDLRPIFP